MKNFTFLLAMALIISLTTCKKIEEKKVELPTIVTMPAVEVTHNSAESGGNITSDGGAEIHTKGVVWGTMQDPSIIQHTGITKDGKGEGLFQSLLTGLDQNTKYYVRAYGENSAGTAYGNQIEFNTLTLGSAPVSSFTASPTRGDAPLEVNYTDQSTNGPTSWYWDFGDGNSSTMKNPQNTYQNHGSYTVQLTVSNNNGTDSETMNNYILVTEEFVWNDVYNSTTGRTWMDRNLGAKQVATSSTDVLSYGDLFQWGRGADGHEKRNSSTTSTLSNSDNPGHGNFILAPVFPNDWRSPQNSNLWQGVNGINNPCPQGYRIPTTIEWEAERQSWPSIDAEGAFNSQLKLTIAGTRRWSDGSLNEVGSQGLYWTSNRENQYYQYLYISEYYANVNPYTAAMGLSVRCIKN